MDDSSYASTLYNNQMKKVTLLTPEQKQERFNNAEQACVGLSASEIYQILLINLAISMLLSV